MAQHEVTNEYLLRLQEQHAREYGMKVDIYYNEIGGVIGIFPHNATPFPPNAIKIIHC